MKYFVQSSEIYEVEADDIDQACDKLSDYLSGTPSETITPIESFISGA